MTWTYSGDPSGSSRDAVRFLVGDTDTNDQQITDEEIAWALTQRSNTYLAAALIAERIAAQYARKVDKSVDSLSISFSQRQEHYLALARQLKRDATKGLAPFAGGVSRSDVESRNADSDRVGPDFKRDQYRYPGLGDTDRDDYEYR